MCKFLRPLYMWHDQGKWVTCRKFQFLFSYTTLSSCQHASFWCKLHYNCISGYRVMNDLSMLKTIQNKGIWTLFLPISEKQHRRHPTHSSWSCHICYFKSPQMIFNSLTFYGWFYSMEFYKYPDSFVGWGAGLLCVGKQTAKYLYEILGIRVWLNPVWELSVDWSKQMRFLNHSETLFNRMVVILERVNLTI